MEAGGGAVVYGTPFSLTGPEIRHAGRTYRLAAKRDFLAFRNLADSLDGFSVKCNNRNEVVVWSKKVPGSPLNVIKVFGVFPNVAPKIIYDVLQDAVYRVTWDNQRIEAFCIVKLDANNDIGYYAAKSPVSGVACRDFVNQRAWLNAGNDEYVIFNTSVPHASVPKDYLKTQGITRDSVVRAISKITGYLVRPWTDGRGNHGSCLTYITQCDPGGWIPTFLVNAITTKFAPLTMRRLAQAASQFGHWLAQQQDYVNDWETSPDSYGTPVQHLTILWVKKSWGLSDGS